MQSSLWILLNCNSNARGQNYVLVCKIHLFSQGRCVFTWLLVLLHFDVCASYGTIVGLFGAVCSIAIQHPIFIRSMERLGITNNFVKIVQLWSAKPQHVSSFLFFKNLIWGISQIWPRDSVRKYTYKLISGDSWNRTLLDA